LESPLAGGFAVMVGAFVPLAADRAL
jgi:hypothetical protein